MSVGSTICTLSVIAFGVSLTVMVSQGIQAAQQPAPAQRDAAALVRQMVHTYQGATTLQDSAKATFTLPTGQKTIQATTIKFKRANQLKLEMQDPANGTLLSYCNGHTVTVYSGTQNIFTKRTAPIEFVRVVRTMEQALDDMLRVKSGQMLSPISFLYASGLPREAGNFTLLGTKKIKTPDAMVHDTYCVLGQASQSWLRELISDPETTMISKEVILWIDRRSHLLVKAFAHVYWRTPISDRKAKQQKYLANGFTFEETHWNTRLNAPVSDEEFHFRPPTKARELFAGEQ